LVLFVETDLSPIEAGSWGTPRGSCLAYRTRRCGTLRTRTKQEPIKFTIILVGISGCRVSWNSESCLFQAKSGLPLASPSPHAD